VGECKWESGTKTKRRIFKKLKEKIGSEKYNQSKSFRITQELKNQVWLWANIR
jgi:hypothetical protein